MKLELKAKHFEHAVFCISGRCAISNAYKDLTGNGCHEYVDELWDDILVRTYSHRDYTLEDFKSDFNKAQSHNWDETVIRTIELIEV